MPLDWTEWRSKLIAVDYPNAASLDEPNVMQLLFRPSAKRKKLVTWMSQKIVDATGFNGTDLLSIYSSFVFGGKETLNGFIEGTHSKNVMENIWNSVLNDLRPTSPICGDKKMRSAILRSGYTTMSPEQFELLGITGPPPDFCNQPDILNRVDDIVNRAEALLKKHPTVVASPAATTFSPPKPSRPLADLIEDVANLNSKIDDYDEDLVRRNEPLIVQIRDVAVNLEEFVVEFRTMKAALKKLESNIIATPSVNLQNY